ncbi:MAG: choice-of-anchor J domain-containing protein [Muribaculaceae bacterium]|nr:choice-of-anchor J domain-containing protein [Muribaculaceae bacterium]
MNIRKVLILSAALTYGVMASAFTPDFVPEQSHRSLKDDGRDSLATYVANIKKMVRPLSATPRAAAGSYTPASGISRAGDDGLIYGGVIYADTWSATRTPFGIYSATTTAPVEVASHYLGEMFTVQGGGFYTEGKYYFINYEIQTFDGEEYVYTTLYQCQTEPFKYEKSYSVSMGHIARDMTFDPIELKVYGIFSVGNLEANYVIGRMNLDPANNDFAITDLIFLDEKTNQVAIAADAKGNVFTIGVDGNLYKLDKQARRLDLIGSTGVKKIDIQYPQSATIDLMTGKFYWAALFTDGSSALYTVDTATGKATKVGNFPDNEEFVGLYAPENVADGAPQAVEELFPLFEEGSLSGLVAFDAPKLSMGGQTLSGNLDYVMSIDGEEKFTGQVRAGKRNEEVEMTLPANGWYTFSVYTSNAAGRSVSKSLRTFVGNDAPVACPTPKAVNEDRGGDISVSWGMPRKGINGGYVDTLKITYDIVRMPDNTAVATDITETKFSDKVTNPDLHAYYYIITPKHQGIAGTPAATNKVIVGHIAQVPYVENFDTEVDFSTYTVQHLGEGALGANSTGTWNYTGYRGGVAQCSPTDGYAKNDWLFTPPIHLEPTRTYNLTYKAMSQGNSIVPSFIEYMEVKMGDAPEAAKMNTMLVENQAILSQYGYFKDYQATIHVSEAGEYYIGFHATTPGADLMWMLNIDDVEITPGAETNGPARVSDLNVTALPKGGLGAVITFGAPSRTVSNKELQSLDKIEITRGDAVIHTFDSPTPGAELTYTDNEAVQGVNRYTVVAYADGNKGLTDTRSVFVGFDLPGEPQNVVLRDVDGTPTVTWEKPSDVGPEGHYVDPDALTYTVVRYFGARDQVVVAKDIKELTFADTELSRPDQAPVTYIVTATNHIGTGEPAYSNSVFAGDGLSELPLRESFPQCYSTSTLAYLSRSEGAAWGVLASESTLGVAPYDNDGGMAVFYLEDNTNIPEEGYSSMLYTDRFSLKDVTKPGVTFYIYFTPGTYNEIQLTVNPESKGWIEQESFYAGEASESGWGPVSVSLDEYADCKFIQIGFRGIARDNGYIFIDNILFDDMLEHNLQLVSIDAPTIVETGQTVEVETVITNRGLNDAENYRIAFYRNDAVFAEVAGPRLAPGMSAIVKTDFKAGVDCEQQNDIRAEIVYAPDCKDSDNVSDVLSVFVDLPRLAYVTDINGTMAADGTVELNWSAPDPATAQPEPVTDGFDTYESFAISGFGPWTVVDGDKQPTWGISSGVSGQILSYPHAGEAMAWQVFNPVKAGLSVDYNPAQDPSGTMLPDWRPRSGSQMLGSFSAKSGACDDWLISPELSGSLQLIKFYARSILNIYPESFELLLSDSGNAPEDFESVGLYTVGMTWKSIAYVVPEGTRYMAIRGISRGQFALMIDDVTYAAAGSEPVAATLKGYNVYVDGTKVTPSPVASTAYTFKSDKSARRYGVTAVYDCGESRMSAPLVLGTAGVGEVTATPALNVAADKGVITLSGVAKKCGIVTTAGTQIWAGSVDGVERVSALPGVYIVYGDFAPVKVIVK